MNFKHCSFPSFYFFVLFFCARVSVFALGAVVEVVVGCGGGGRLVGQSQFAVAGCCPFAL